MNLPAGRNPAFARHVLAAYAIPIGADFHTLGSDQIAGILAAADWCNYRKPRNANGSRARAFHARLDRLARKES